MRHLRGEWQEHMSNYSGMQGGWLMMLVILVILGAAIALFVWLLTTNSSSANDKVTSDQSAIDVVDLRFARGEIDAEQRQELLRVLGSPTHD